MNTQATREPAYQMQFLRLGSKVKFRAHEGQAYQMGTIVGHTILYPDHVRAYPVYLIELHEGFYHNQPGSPAVHPFYVSILPVSCDLVEMIHE